MSRIEDIKAKFITENMPVYMPTLRERYGESRQVKRWTGDAGDVMWLINRVGELERENERLREEAEGLHAMIQQAIHPQSE